MTLQAAPPISLADIAAELGVASFSFTDPRVQLLAGRSGQSIQMSNFLGKTSQRTTIFCGDDNGTNFGGVRDVGYSKQFGLVVIGSMANDQLKGQQVLRIVDQPDRATPQCLVEVQGLLPQNFFYGAVINGVGILSANAAWSWNDGGTPTSQYTIWTYTGKFNLTALANANVEFFF